MTGTWCITCVSRYRFCRVSDNKNINIGRLCTFRQHLIKHWAPTQKVVTLSPGEAELYGVVKGATEALGLRSLAQDMGVSALAQVSSFAWQGEQASRRGDRSPLEVRLVDASCSALGRA